MSPSINFIWYHNCCPFSCIFLFKTFYKYDTFSPFGNILLKHQNNVHHYPFFCKYILPCKIVHHILFYFHNLSFCPPEKFVPMVTFMKSILLSNTSRFSHLLNFYLNEHDFTVWGLVIWKVKIVICDIKWCKLNTMTVFLISIVKHHIVKDNWFPYLHYYLSRVSKSLCIRGVEVQIQGNK